MTTYMSASQLSKTAIEGLMLLGRTQEEAVRELMDAERRQDQKAVDAFWSSGYRNNA